VWLWGELSSIMKFLMLLPVVILSLWIAYITGAAIYNTICGGCLIR
jgi:hypothetical protein